MQLSEFENKVKKLFSFYSCSVGIEVKDNRIWVIRLLNDDGRIEVCLIPDLKQFEIRLVDYSDMEEINAWDNALYSFLVVEMNLWG